MLIQATKLGVVVFIPFLVIGIVADGLQSWQQELDDIAIKFESLAE